MDVDGKEKNTEELDLWNLLKKIWDACYSAVAKFLTYLLRKSLWIVSFTIIGIGFCVFICSVEKKYYSSTVQMRSSVNSSLVIPQIDALDDLIKAAKHEDLALILQLPIEVVEEVKSIKGLYAIDVNDDEEPDYADINEYVKNNPQDTTVKKVSNYFYLKLDVYSDVVFPNVAKTLKEYLGKNEFLERENEIIVTQRQELLKEVKKQVAMLDSFQRVEYFEKGRQGYGSENLFMLGDKGQQLYHQDYISLYNQQLKLEKEVDLYSDDIITVIQDFPPLTSPANSFSSYLKKHLWRFIVLSIVCAIVWDNRKFLLSHMFGQKKKKVN